MNTAVAEEPSSLKNHPVVSKDRWLAQRKALLAREKELTHLRDQIARERRAMPWTRVEKNYSFDTPKAHASSPISSRAAANWWCSTSCSAQTGSKAARAARTWPITLRACRCTWNTAT